MYQDIRYALRMLSKNRAFAAVAILSLALGIGANTAIFTLIDYVVLRALPARSPEQLVVLARNPEKPTASFNYPDYRYIRDHNQLYDGVIAASEGTPLAFTVPGEKGATAEVVPIARVSGNYFDVLGVRPALGRLFTPDDNVNEGAHPYIVLSYGFWQRRFGADPKVLGRGVTLNGVPFTIVGVAERRFHGINIGNSSDLFTPIMMMSTVNPAARGVWNTRHYWWLRVMARLKPGVTFGSATGELNVLWQQILKADPTYKPPPVYAKDAQSYNRMVVLPGSGGWSDLRLQFSKPLNVLMIVAGLVLLIACANVANLLLARAAGRQKEIAVRLAIGAGRARLVRQLLMETLVVSVLGGLAGLAFAWWGVAVLLQLLPKRVIPIELHLTPDVRVLGFAFLASLITTLVCGLLPALQSTRPNLLGALKSETSASRRSRFEPRRALIVLQVAISLLLLIGAGLFLRSLSNLESLDPGFRRDRVLLVSVNPQASGYKGQRLRDYYERLLAAVRSWPDVRAAALANITPLSGSQWNNSVVVEGYRRRADESPDVDFNSVSPRFFETMGIRFIAGRDFRDQDNPTDTPESNSKKPGPRVVIVNESFAKRYFAGRPILGGRLCRGDQFKADEAYEIVGVANDAMYFGVRQATEPMIYVPVWHGGAGGRTLVLRTADSPAQSVTAIRREAAALDPAVPVLQTLTMSEQFDNNIAQERMLTTLCAFFGGLALLLAAVGLYGVMSHSAARRVREIGIRMALGAERAAVLWLVLREIAIMVGIGAVVGLPVAFALTRLVRAYLFGLTPQDPLSIVVAVAALLAMTALAGLAPARRAARVDPLVALRHE